MRMMIGAVAIGLFGATAAHGDAQAVPKAIYADPPADPAWNIDPARIVIMGHSLGDLAEPGGTPSSQIAARIVA